jgi:hypothetical protein
MLKLPASELKNPASGLIVRVPASSFTMRSPRIVIPLENGSAKSLS